jgi:hypothetical protein
MESPTAPNVAGSGTMARLMPLTCVPVMSCVAHAVAPASPSMQAVLV